MKHLEVNKLLWIILFGTIWGIIESTGGWLIHLLHIHYYFTPSLILIGIVCMILGVNKTNLPMGAFSVAIIASLFKLSNLLFISPYPSSWVLIPSFYILMEGLVVTLILHLVQTLISKYQVKSIIIFKKVK